MVIVLLLLLAAQTEDRLKPRKPALPPEIRTIVELARAVPPEFAASALLELQHGGRIPGRELQRELIEEAFLYASRAKEPVPRVALPGTPPDTRAMFRGKANEQKMDRLSLQVGAVKAMLDIDRRAARDLFSQIHLPAWERTACEDPLLPYTSDFYALLSPIAQSTFTDKEKAEQEHVRFLLTWLARIASPGDLASFARSMGGVALSREQWELLVSAFAAKLENIAIDFRSFAITAESLRAEIEQIVARGVGRELLARALRRYLVNQLSAPRCTDELMSSSEIVDWFNRDFRTDLPLIAEDEIRPAKRGDRIKTERYFLTGAAEKVTAILANGRAQDVLLELQGPGVFSDKSEIDDFHQKAIMLRALLEKARGEDRDRVIQALLGLLATSSALNESPMEWAWHLKTAISLDRPKFTAALRASSNPLFALVAAVEDLKPSSH